MKTLVPIRCKNCNSELAPPENGVYRCEWCGSSFAVEEISDANTRSDEESNGFITVASILQKYVGGATEINIPSHITVIAENAFAGLSTVRSVTLPDGLTEIGDGAFRGCEGLSHIVLPTGLKSIGNNAFRGCGFTELTVDSALEVLGESAFADCTRLKRLTLGSPLPQNCKNTFKNCAALSEVKSAGDIFAPSFFTSVDADKYGDKRPTYADLFQGTEYFKRLHAAYNSHKCIYCGGELNILHKCKGCGIQFYKPRGGCYIATCVYGSYDCGDVCVLRRFRDDCLAESFLGRMFIRIYYALSPTAVRLFGRSRLFSAIFKPLLDRLVTRLRAKGYSDTPYRDRT